jgi:acyl carrier protein
MSVASPCYGPLKDILAEKVGLDGETVDRSPTATLAELGVDSLGVLEFEVTVTERFGLALPDTTVEMSIEQIVDFVTNALKESSS